MAEENQRELHVVMFPWFARGHITPFLEFATRLVNHGIKISFVSTPLNIKRIKEQIIVAGIHPVELAMPSVEGLPPGVESTADAKGERAALLIPLLFRALDLLKKPFEELLRQLSPDYVIHDLVEWIPRLAAKLAIPIPTITFLTTGVASMSFDEGQMANGLRSATPEDLTVPPPGFPSTIVGRRLFEARKSMPLHQKNEEGISIADRLSICFRESRAIACNTCLELEGVYVEYLQSLTGRPVLPVGILMPDLPPRLGADFCLEWLDRQSATSVVFVSFGSEYTLTNEETTALAMGLEDSTASFLWVMPTFNAAAPLPQGFQHRNRERGLILTQWAPQLHILNHPSTGAFITHCGWNSFTEGLRFGVPLITLPMQFEQGFNAKLAKELKVGVEMSRNEEDGSFTKDDISKAIRSVMEEEQGTRVKCNVAQISNLLSSNGGQVCRINIEKFVSLLRNPQTNDIVRKE